MRVRQDTTQVENLTVSTPQIFDEAVKAYWGQLQDDQ
jgi:hypothetical protein